MKKSFILLLSGVFWGCFVMGMFNTNLDNLDNIIDFRQEFLQLKPNFYINSLDNNSLYNLLIKSWQEKLTQNIIKYNPEDSLKEFPVINFIENNLIKYSFFCENKRGSKPGKKCDIFNENIKRIRKPEELNPFQTVNTYNNNVISYIISQDRTRIYSMQVNAFPIYKNHFLLISTIKDKPQYIYCTQEIYDLLYLQDYLERYNFNLAFNSNNAGSSINVWHAQIVQFNVNGFKEAIKVPEEYKNNNKVYMSQIDFLAVSHKVFLSKSKEILSEIVFKYINILNNNNNPYNLVFFKNKENFFGIIIFIRGNWQENANHYETSLDHSPGFAECIGDLLLLKPEQYFFLKELNLRDNNQFKKIVYYWQKAAGQSEEKIIFFDSLFFK